MVHELHYHTIVIVLETWERLRRVKDYELVAGAKLFERLFNRCPKAKTLFGYPLDVTTKELLSSKRFVMHGAYLIQMLDSALNLLGPDVELLTEIMIDLGTKHVRYGVTADMFPFMGVSLIETMEEILGSSVMTREAKEAWLETYADLTEDMIKVIQKVSAVTKKK